MHDAKKSEANQQLNIYFTSYFEFYYAIEILPRHASIKTARRIEIRHIKISMIILIKYALGSK